MTLKRVLIIIGILILIYLAAPTIHIKATDAGGMPSSTTAASATVLPPETTTTTIDLSFLNTTTTTHPQTTTTRKPQETKTYTVGNWDMLAQCETGGNWSTNTGNGYGGGLQFAHTNSWSSWRSFGGTEFSDNPWDATREQQIVVAERILASNGWKAWPGCANKLGFL